MSSSRGSQYGLLVFTGALFASAKYTSLHLPRKPATKVNTDRVFDELFPKLTRRFLDYTRDHFGFAGTAIQRLERMLNYTCVGGKMNRGRMVVSTTELLCKNTGLDFEERLEAACALGWCIEILQACFLVADDIMDGSTTRRGQPCWYKVADVQLDAVNDSLILESFLYWIIKEYFAGTDNYIPLVELYHDVSYRTQLGQMMDLVSQPQGPDRKKHTNLGDFNMQLYRTIVWYKTAFYSFYLPLASGMLLCGFSSKKQLEVAHKISVELGEKFQIQDDYLDCYGDPEKIGKIGTDIIDHKCSWLVVKVLELASEEQLTVLKTHYGKHNDESVAAVKKLFSDIRIPELYEKQEQASWDRCVNMMKEYDDIVPSVVFKVVLDKIHRREK